MQHFWTVYGIPGLIILATVYLRVSMKRITKAQTKALANVLSTAFKMVATRLDNPVKPKEGNVDVGTKSGDTYRSYS